MKCEFLKLVQRKPDLYDSYDLNLDNAHQKVQRLQDDYCYLDPGDREKLGDLEDNSWQRIKKFEKAPAIEPKYTSYQLRNERYEERKEEMKSRILVKRQSAGYNSTTSSARKPEMMSSFYLVLNKKSKKHQRSPQSKDVNATANTTGNAHFKSY